MLEFIFGLFKFSFSLGMVAIGIAALWYVYVFTVWVLSEGLSQFLLFIHKLTGW